MNSFDDYSGKIDSHLFAGVLSQKFGHKRDEIITGPAFGVDTSVIDLGNGQGMAVSSDPLSLIPSLGLQESAWLSVHLLVNDMATTGHSPMYAQFVLNLPVSLTLEAFQEYWSHIHHYCNETGVAITGGHTGRIEGQESSISGGGTMFLTAPLESIVTSDGARPGDRLIVTKEAALTATSILSLSFPETVKNAIGEELHRNACENFWRTSSLSEGLAAAQILRPNQELTAMHDVTEGGVLGAIRELATASGCGFFVDADNIPLGRGPKGVADLFGIDPLLCVGAGSMVLAVRPGNEEDLLHSLQVQGIPAAIVGSLTDREQGFRIVENGVDTSFRFTGRDPYWAAFFRALERGWR